MTKNETMLNWVGEMRELVQPDQVVWIDGSQEQLEALRAKACNDGDLIKLNQEKLPGCYLHRTALNENRKKQRSTNKTAKKKRMPDLPITGKSLLKLIKCFTILQEAATKEKRCM